MQLEVQLADAPTGEWKEELPLKEGHGEGRHLGWRLTESSPGNGSTVCMHILQVLCRGGSEATPDSRAGEGSRQSRGFMLSSLQG